MNNRLFYEDSYINEWTADIETVDSKEDNYVVTLDRTYFYPEGGGQPSDIGTIDGIEVTYVYEDNETIYHVLKEKPCNKSVKCVLDFERRFDNMQQHSGEHMLAGAFYKLFGAQSTGFHMGEEYVNIDIFMPEITEEMLLSAENTACDNIYKDIEFVTYFTDDRNVAEISLRKECKAKGEIRIVEIPGVDRIACCGTHVKRTGEIGTIKIIRAEKYKGMTRVYFKCGKRAQKDYQGKHNIVSSLVRHYLAPESDLLTRTEYESNMLKTYEREIKNLKERILHYECDEILSEENNGYIFKEFEDKTSDDIQIMCKYIMEKGKFILVLSSKRDKKLIFANNFNDAISCGEIFKEILNKFSGKGGGNKKQAQAGFTVVEDLNDCYEYLKNVVEEK